MKKIKSNGLDKRAQLGATITWFGAFLIIVLIMVFFIISSMFLVNKKFISKNINTIGFSEGQYTVADVQRPILIFLNSPVGLNGEERTIYDLILLSDLDDETSSSIFKKKAEEIFSKQFPYGEDAEWWQGVNPWWIGVYYFDQSLKRTDLEKRKFYFGSRSCDPLSKDNTVKIVYIGEKKLVFCILNSYYRKLVEQRKNVGF